MNYRKEVLTCPTVIYNTEVFPYHFHILTITAVVKAQHVTQHNAHLIFSLHVQVESRRFPLWKKADKPGKVQTT